MSVPDPYRQPQPQGYPPPPPPQPYGGTPYTPPAAQYPPPPGYPQPYAMPVQPAAPVYPVQNAPPPPPGSNFQQQAFQAPVQPAQPVPVQPTPVQPAQPTPLRPIPVAAAKAQTPTAATAARPVLVKKPKSDAVKVAEAATEDDVEEQPLITVKSAPPWLISLVVHMVALILMGLVYYSQTEKSQVDVEVSWAERLGEQLIDSSVLSSSIEEIEELDKEFSESLQFVEDPFAAPPTQLIDPLVAGTTATVDLSAPSIGMALTGREKGAKKALLAAYGGTKLTEDAVVAGLTWLKKNQRGDGSWSLMGPYSDGSNQENATAATAMALIAFQGAGNTHRDGDFKDVVAKAWKWMLSKQDADGNFVQEPVYNARLYTQAQCTIAICELYGMTKDPQYRKPAQLAIDYAIKSQDQSGGGWRYTPRVDSDLSVTGWFVIALQSALMAGLEVPSPQLEMISKFLDSVQYEDGSLYAYKPGNGPTLPMTAEGLLCRQYLGWKHADPRLHTGVKYLLENKISYDDQNVYYWYYAAQVLHHMGGAEWDEWNAVMREAVPNAQTQTGKEAGSWSPSNDRWGAHGGRLYTTCLSIYVLEVYYRHLPVYKHQLQ